MILLVIILEDMNAVQLNVTQINSVFFEQSNEFKTRFDVRLRVVRRVCETSRESEDVVMSGLSKTEAQTAVYLVKESFVEGVEVFDFYSLKRGLKDLDTKGGFEAIHASLEQHKHMRQQPQEHAEEPQEHAEEQQDQEVPTQDSLDPEQLLGRHEFPTPDPGYSEHDNPYIISDDEEPSGTADPDVFSVLDEEEPEENC